MCQNNNGVFPLLSFFLPPSLFLFIAFISNVTKYLIIVLCSYYFTFRLWENWYELWVENFLRFTRETKIGLEKPILKFRVPAGHEKFQRLREANFCLPREPEKTFHEHFISVWAHPKGKILRTDCFISFFGYLCVILLKSKSILQQLWIKLWMPPVSKSSPENSPNYGCSQFPGVPLKIARPAFFR